MGSPSSLSLGSLTPWSTWGEYNKIAFVVQQLLSRVQTATLVKIIACSNSGDLSPVGSVDVQPLVNQIDGNQQPTPHGTIFGLPYLRMQGGTDAVIMDPKPGDIGLAVFASRDISKVKSTQAQANPGSFRQYDFADGMYLGGMLNGVPVQYIRFSSDGIEIVSPTAVKITAPVISLDGAVTISETLTVTGNIVAEADLTITGTTIGDGINLTTHTHPAGLLTTFPTGAPLP